MGMSLLTFDWAQIAYIGSPLATPWWAAANVGAGFVMFFWIVTPALYYSNTWYAQYMPISSRGSFDRFGQPYNVTNIINDNLTLNLQSYKEYSPLFLSTTFALSYGLSFASITATLMHAFLYYRKQIWTQARRSLSEQPDIHARLMSRYPEVSELWYIGVFISMFIFAIIAIEIYKTQFPVWAFIIALLIGIFRLVWFATPF
jgi:OPT family oligopeptide transporter